MAHFPAIQQILWISANCLEVGLVFRLCSLRLHRYYPWFIAFLVLGVGRTLLLVGLNPGSEEYGMRWALTEPALMLVQAGMALEVFRHITRPYPALGRFGVWALSALLAMALVIAAGSMELERDAANWWSHLINTVSFSRRFVSSALALFLIFTAGLFAFVPVPNHRNVRIHTIISTIYFSLYAFGMLAAHVRVMESREIGLLMLVGSSACFLAWLVLLSEQPVEQVVSATEEEKVVIEERAAAALGFLRSKSRLWRG